MFQVSPRVLRTFLNRDTVCSDDVTYRVSVLTTDTRVAFSTGNIRKICKYTHGPESKYSMLGLDTHADISCAGRDAWILAQVEGRTCSVHPFNDSYKAI